jgi:hypothetical protein
MICHREISHSYVTDVSSSKIVSYSTHMSPSKYYPPSSQSVLRQWHGLLDIFITGIYSS